MYRPWSLFLLILDCSCLIPSSSVQANILEHERRRGGRRHCSNQFCIEPDYKKLELPPPNNGTSVQVIITPHILEIFEVSITDNLMIVRQNTLRRSGKEKRYTFPILA